MEKKEKKPFMTDERKSRILFSALIAIGVPLLVFIAVPLDIYQANKAELNYWISDMILGLLLLFLFSAAIIFAVLFVVPPMAYKVLRGLAVGGGLMIFLQSNYLNAGLRSLTADGVLTISDIVGKTTVIVNTIVWIIVVGGCTAASILIKKTDITRLAAIVLALVICFTQVLNVLVILMNGVEKVSTMDEIRKEDENFVPSFLTFKNLNTVAQDNNIVVFVVDRFDASYYEENEQMCNGYLNDFGGFTYFSDHTSMYNFTYPSVAYLATRTTVASNNEDRKDYFTRAWQQNQTLSKLDEQGYDINIYTDPYYGYYDAYYFPDYVDNVERVSEESVYRIKAGLLRTTYYSAMMSLYRILPFCLKDVATLFSNVFTDDVKYTSTELLNTQASANMKHAYDEVRKVDFTKNGNKNFTMLHFSGCHDLIYDENWNQASTSTIPIVLKHSFSVIDEYIDEMKKQGVYENSTIIITGDHGSPTDWYGHKQWSTMTALFVKPANVSGGALQTNTAQVSHENLWATIFKSEGIAFDESVFGQSVFDVDPSVNHTRRHFNAMVEDDGGWVYVPYEITGPGKDFSNWKIINE